MTAAEWWGFWFWIALGALTIALACVGEVVDRIATKRGWW